MRALAATLALALALIAAPAAAAPAPTLVIDSAVLLLRHGVRPPTHEPALPTAIAPLPWPSWPAAPGDLTPHGAKAIALLAAYDRQAFAAQGLLPATGCPAGVTIYADVDERTVATGAAFAAGFAPGCRLPVVHANGPSDPLFSALDAPDPHFDAKRAKAAMQAAAGGDVAELPQVHRDLFQAMQTALDPGGQAFLDLPAKLSAKTPNQVPKLSGPLTEGASGAEDFLLEYLDGKPLSEVGWGRVSPAEIPVLLALHPLAYTITARPAAIADRGAAPLAARILAALTGGQKLTLLVGHDTNQAELGGMLGLHWSLGGYPADDPPPGGGILFMRAHDPATGRTYVTATYQVQTMDQIRNLAPLTSRTPPALQPLPIPGCGNSAAPTACPLATFAKLVTP
jgi:4-phytase/acid phosphatase